MSTETKKESLGEAVYNKIEDMVNETVDHMNTEFSMTGEDIQFAFNDAIEDFFERLDDPNYEVPSDFVEQVEDYINGLAKKFQNEVERNADTPKTKEEAPKTQDEKDAELKAEYAKESYREDAERFTDNEATKDVYAEFMLPFHPL